MRSPTPLFGRLKLVALVFFLVSTAPPCAFAGFLSTETFLPAVGRLPGQDGARFFTTVWATNLTETAVSLKFEFLQQGRANPDPASFSDSLQPGQTKMYENVLEASLGISDAIGAARVVSSGPILLAERIFNQTSGDDLGKSQGLFFSGSPKSFSISPGQSATIQGVNQGGSESFRYNFALIETGGGSPTVHVALLDAGGAPLGSKDFVLQPYEQVQPNVAEVFPGVATTNARITATVTGGAGSVLLAGAQVANESQDGTGFEMSFPDLLTSAVTSLNGLTGALTLEAGSNVAITQDGTNAIKISSTAAQGPAGPRGAAGPQGPPGPVNAVSTDTPNTAALRDGSGSFAMDTLSLDGNLVLPTSAAATGVIEVAGIPFIHSFGSYNTFIGQSAGNFTLTGAGNMASGALALGADTTGFGNTAIGSAALYSNTSGSANTATGESALGGNTVGSGNTAVGSEALQSNTTGTWNTAIGGSYALELNTTGSDNTAVGTSALFSNTTGSRNIAIGSGAGQNLDGHDDNIDIGNQGVAGDASTIRIGSTAQSETFIAGIRGKATGNNDAVAVVIDSSGQLGTISSSRRYKEDIRDMGEASSRVMDLRPVTFRYRKPFADGAKPIQYGLIAEEVARTFPDLVAYGADGKPETVKYQVLSSLLLNELQKQRSTVARLNRANEELEAQLISLAQANAARLAALAARISRMERNSATTELARREAPAN